MGFKPVRRQSFILKLHGGLPTLHLNGIQTHSKIILHSQAGWRASCAPLEWDLNPIEDNLAFSCWAESLHAPLEWDLNPIEDNLSLLSWMERFARSTSMGFKPNQRQFCILKLGGEFRTLHLNEIRTHSTTIFHF